MTDRPDMLTELVVDAERRWDAACAMLAALKHIVARLDRNVPHFDTFDAARAIAQAEEAGIK